MLYDLWSLLRAEGFSCTLDVLYGCQGISKLQFLIKKVLNFFPPVNVFQCLDIKIPRIWIRIDLKCWIRIRTRIETNADPGHWFKAYTSVIMTTHSIVP
jgi:hypothetical protein